MTDEQIVKTLAEFMGWTDVLFVGGRLHGLDPSDPGGPRLATWLTSYDAIAEVWQKSDDMLYESATHYLQNGICFDDWYSRTPRQHAEALAMAILEAKEK